MYQNLFSKLIEKGLYNAKKQKCSPWLDRRIDFQLSQEILDATSFLEYQENLANRISIMSLNICFQPKCLECGAITKYERTKKRFLEFCSTECSMKSKITKTKRKETVFEKFGVTSNFLALTPKQRSNNARKAAISAKKTIFAKYGVTNAMDIPGVKEKHKTSMGKPDVQAKRFSTLADNFGSIEEFYRSKREKMKVGEYCEYDKAKLAEYRRAVYGFTNQNDLEKLHNYEKRGRLDLDKNCYHLDHKYSILEGFKNNIPASIIGSFDNLEMILGTDNISKSDLCSTTVGYLFVCAELRQ